MPKAVSRQSKNKQKASKIAKAKASAGMNQKLAEDKTFGMKNKNRSKKIQKFIQQQTQQQGRSLSDDEQAARAAKKAKEAKERREREMALLFKQAPKSKGEIAREKAAAAAKVARVNKSGKIDLYADPRAAEKEARKAETSGDWDQAKLEQVVKMKAMGEKKRETEIVCKHFLTAVHKGLYGWFWQCPSGKNCQYKHNLPPGFILKKPKDSDEEEEDDGPTLEEVIEEQRAKLTAEGTPVTLESFMAWKEKKKKEQAEKKEEKKDEKMKKLSKVERSMGMGLSGRELFDFKPDAFVDDDSAADDIEQYKGVGAEEMDEDLYVVAEEEETSAFDDNDESLFDEFEDEPEPAVETAAEREAREERMALETVEAAKDMEEDGELETALAMFEEAWAVLGAKRPKLKNRINKLKQEVAAAGGRAGTPAGAEPEPEPEPADRPSTAPAAVGVDVDESLFEDSDDSD